MELDKYMMATKAYHKLGNISRDEPDLCHIHMERENDYIGSWVTGFGFIEVTFPKETTRELTEDEVKAYGKTYIQIGNQPPIKLNIKEKGNE